MKDFYTSLSAKWHAADDLCTLDAHKIQNAPDQTPNYGIAASNSKSIRPKPMQKLLCSGGIPVERKHK